MAFGRIVVAWAAVAAWLVTWPLAGAWWLVFLLLGTLMEWPVRSPIGAARITRVVASGCPLAWTGAA